jgi:predicted NAD/FAD-binding protein
MTRVPVVGLPPLPTGRRLNIAVIGSGIAGLSAAWLLSRRHDVTLYEKNERLGGHSNTVEVDYDGERMAVDTGFIVYNERNYPNLTKLFGHLGVVTQPSSMSFSVSVDGGDLEYSGGTWGGLFAQPTNVFRPGHWRMLADIMRFFREAPMLLSDASDERSLGRFLSDQRYSRSFMENHLLPMGAAIWSVPATRMLEFRARSFAQFFHNHGLLRLTRRPVWRSVAGGSARYIERMMRGFGGRVVADAAVTRVEPGPFGVTIHDRKGTIRRFDAAIVAAHADEALAMLADPSDDERRVLGAFRYQPNVAVLHRDAALMPKRRLAWASWNYLAQRNAAGRGDGASGESLDVSVTYWMNKLQTLDRRRPLFVSLNPIRAPRRDKIFATFDYHHPAFDAEAARAQASLSAIQGRRGVWFCGSYCGYGFHEDALSSGLAAAEAFGVTRPWAVAQPAPCVRDVPLPAPAIAVPRPLRV